MVGLKQGYREYAIESVKQTGKMGRMKYKRFKDAIKELTTDEQLTEPDDCILELDGKIQQAARHYR
jgi:hypothetical protein